ncbi:unnamed protein product, partial [marine sediment metagenome]
QEIIYDPNNLKPSFDDKFPPKTFLVSLDSEISGMQTNSKDFFGTGGVDSPDGLKNNLTNNITSTGVESSM